MKTCFKCGMVLPLTEFYRHPAMNDGHLGKCRNCAKRDVSENRRANGEYYRAYEASRSRRPYRIALKRQLALREAAEHPERVKARGKVARAIRSGHLAKSPCVICGHRARVEAHHDDYAKPLDVRWLCPSHHRLADRGVL